MRLPPKLLAVIRQMATELRHVRGLLQQEPRAIRMEADRLSVMWECRHWFALVLARSAQDALDDNPEAKNYIEWTLTPADGSGPLIVQVRRAWGGKQPSEVVSALKSQLAEIAVLSESVGVPRSSDAANTLLYAIHSVATR